MKSCKRIKVLLYWLYIYRTSRSDGSHCMMHLIGSPCLVPAVCLLSFPILFPLSRANFSHVLMDPNLQASSQRRSLQVSFTPGQTRQLRPPLAGSWSPHSASCSIPLTVVSAILLWVICHCQLLYKAVTSSAHLSLTNTQNLRFKLNWYLLNKLHKLSLFYPECSTG